VAGWSRHLGTGLPRWQERSAVSRFVRVGNGAGRGAAAKIRRMKRGIGGGALDRGH